MVGGKCQGELCNTTTW